MQLAALDEPVDLELHARVDEVVEVPAGVFEGECVGVDERLGDEEVNLGRERVERGFVVAVAVVVVVDRFFAGHRAVAGC